MPRVDFWFDFASTYSYPAAMRIDELAAARKIAVVWRPFLLGPIFVEQGWRDSPFNLYPIKGRYMWRDLERLCQRDGLAFRRPPAFPQNSLAAARLAWAVPPDGRARFCRAVFRAQFGEGRSIEDADTLAAILARYDLPQDLIAASGADAIKLKLRDETRAAQAAGLFGAPSFTTADGELFWGNDRLVEALDWAAAPGMAVADASR